MSKIPVDVVIHDNDIVVRCDDGMWNLGGIDNRWLWVLGAIAFPEEHKLTIYDSRKHRQEHQKDLSTTTKYERLAKDIYNWCVEHELWDDNTIYFDGKAWSNLPTWGGEKGIKICEDLYEYANRNPKNYFEYANPDTLSMSFEGGLNHVLNEYVDNCLPLIEEFRELFHKYGLYWEFGNSWNLSAAKE